MRVELFPPDSETAPRHWVRHDQAFAMMLRPGSIEWGEKRSALKRFNYAPCDLALCHRHEGEWVGLMNVQHLQLGISDSALARHKLGSLHKVTRVVRLCVYIATEGDFFDQPKVADASSELFRDVFGEDKTSVRMVLGVASLPLGMPVAVEVIMEVEV
ncbi:MAG TPA: RidA family protein [Candidatus Binatus sp.]|nr:RidA family protein [Candidatus Binatus sp.]